MVLGFDENMLFDFAKGGKGKGFMDFGKGGKGKGKGKGFKNFLQNFGDESQFWRFWDFR